MGVIENRIDILELERSGGGGGGGTAADVTYDNATSHMTATDVQAALDELNLDIAEGLALVNTSVAANRTAITATQENLAPVENGATSDGSYLAGTIITHQNSLMLVIADISVGDPFVVGTNIELNGALTNKIRVTSSTDLNNLRGDNRTYYAVAGSLPTNNPSTAPATNCIVDNRSFSFVTNEITTEQTYTTFASGRVYKYCRRYFPGTGWGNWYEYTMTELV